MCIELPRSGSTKKSSRKVQIQKMSVCVIFLELCADLLEHIYIYTVKLFTGPRLGFFNSY